MVMWYEGKNLARVWQGGFKLIVSIKFTVFSISDRINHCVFKRLKNKVTPDTQTQSSNDNLEVVRILSVMQEKMGSLLATRQKLSLLLPRKPIQSRYQ